MTAKKDARKHGRIHFQSGVRLSWEDSAGPKFTTGKCLDISDGGLRIEVLAMIPVGARVVLSVERIKLGGVASVKHVSRRGAKYEVRLELSQPLSGNIIAAIRDALPRPDSGG
jgi:hypothetical protein